MTRVIAAAARELKVLKQDDKKDTADSKRGRGRNAGRKEGNKEGRILCVRFGVGLTGQPCAHACTHARTHTYTNTHTDTYFGPDAQICLAIVNQSNKEI